MKRTVEIRDLERTELPRVGEIDRTERIDVLFEQRGTELVSRRATWNAPPWDPDGRGEHSVHAQHQSLVHYFDAGGIVRGACRCARIVAEDWAEFWPSARSPRSAPRYRVA